MFNPESIDLADLARGLAEKLAGVRLEGFVVGRTVLRDAVAERLACSQLEAEQLVDTLVAQQYVFFERTSEPAGWVFDLPRIGARPRWRR